MSFLSVIGNIIGAVIPGGSVITAVLSAIALNKLKKSIAKDNAAAGTKAEDKGTKVTVQPSVDNKIPVLYGRAITGGIITDVAIQDNNLRLDVCYTICEQTGVVFSTDVASVFTPKDVYIDGKKVVFDSNGYSVKYLVDSEGVKDEKFAGLIQILFFDGNSSIYRPMPGFESKYASDAFDARDNMLGWYGNQEMQELVFAIVRLFYNADKGLTSIPSIAFDVENSLTEPGDCLFDYMTSPRYGAAIPFWEISK